MLGLRAEQPEALCGAGWAYAVERAGWDKAEGFLQRCKDLGSTSAQDKQMIDAKLQGLAAMRKSGQPESAPEGEKAPNPAAVGGSGSMLDKVSGEAAPQEGAPAEGAAVDEVDVRVVEGVLHQAQPRAAPHFVELLDAPEPRVVPFLDVRDVEKRRGVEADPDVAVALGGGKARYARPFGSVSRNLRDPQHPAGMVVGPAVVAADDLAALAVAARELGGAVAAAVLQRGGLAGLVEEEHELLAEELEGLGAVGQVGQGHHGVPEAPQDLLLGGEHGNLAFQ